MAQNVKVAQRTKEKKKSSKKYLAIIRVRGRVGVREDIAETLRRLRLHKPNHLAVYEDTPVIRGMVNKVKDYVTWGEVSEDFIKELDKKVEKEVDGLYRLQPPRKGWGRKGIKYTYAQGGALG